MKRFASIPATWPRLPKSRHSLLPIDGNGDSWYTGKREG